MEHSVKKLRMKVVINIMIILLSNLFFISSVEATNNEAYVLYYDLIQEKLETVGYYESYEYKNSYFKRAGIVYANTIDFDLNGTDELVIFESIKEDSKSELYSILGDSYYLHYSIYTYSDGKLINLITDQIYTAGTGDYFGFCKDKNNRTYFYYENNISSDERITYGTVVNGVWKVSKLTTQFIPSWSESFNVNGEHYHVSSNRGKYLYYIDDVEVTNDKFNAFRKEKRTNLYEIYNIDGQSHEYGSVGDNYYLKLQPIPDYTPQKTLEQIAPFIPEFVAHYKAPSEWATSIVNSAIEEGYVDKVLQKKYTTPITREEFCILAIKFYEKITDKEIVGRVYFSDTSSEAVKKIASLGVVNGVGEGKFAPSALLTREMAAVILSRLAEEMNIPLETMEPYFEDTYLISSWATEHVGKIQHAGIMNGVETGIFAPKKYYTREQSIATIMRLKESFVEVEKLKIQKKVEILKKDTIEPLQVTFYPDNATDRAIEWSSSDEDIFRVDMDGYITGINAGEATLTAKSKNGVKTECKVIVTSIYANLKTPLGKELNVLSNKHKGIYKYDYIPEDPKISSKIKVTNAVDSDKYSFKKGVKLTIELTEIVKGYDEELLDVYFNPYIKWKLTDEENEVVETGVEYLALEKVGDEVEIEIIFENIVDGNKYYLEFANDKGELFDYEESEPEVEIQKLPIRINKVQGYGLDKKDVTMIIEEINVEYKYSGYSDDYDAWIYICGKIEEGDSFKGFEWKLTDSNGETIESKFYDSMSVYSGVNADGTFEYLLASCVEMQKGETYYLEFIED